VSGRALFCTYYSNQISPSGTFPNLNDPLGIAFDSSSCHLYVVNQGGAYITEYDQNGNQISPSGTFPNIGLLPYGIAFVSSNRHLYVDNVYSNAIAVYDQSGNQITPSGTFPNLNGPTLLTAVP
jgi:DNA-binding beta-propeller fold protein YncE